MIHIYYNIVFIMMFIFAKIEFITLIVYEQQVAFSFSFSALKFKQKQQIVHQIESSKWKNAKIHFISVLT